MRKTALCACLLSLFCSAAAAQTRTYTLKDGSTLEYGEPGLWRAVGFGPSDFGLFVRDSFSKESLPWLAAVGASTVLLIKYDQEIYEEARRAGKRLNISSADKTKTYLKAGGVSLFRGPSDLGSALYFVGDGWVNLGLFGYFEISGALKDDWRERQTGHQLAEGLLVTGFATQVLKRVSGRETPSAATGDGGVWRMFPSFGDFQKHRTRYDAFPSGHIATCAMTLTVIDANYPDKWYIRPIGYALLAGLSFQMVNNGVHWASDYPLSLAMGYGIGKAIAREGRGAARRGPAPKASLDLAPYLTADGTVGARLAYRF